MYQQDVSPNPQYPNQCDRCELPSTIYYTIERLDIQTKTTKFILSKDLSEQNFCPLCFAEIVVNFQPLAKINGAPNQLQEKV